MKFISTRGRAPAIGFREAVLKGLAADGGLYMPDAWPSLPAGELAAFAGLTFAEAAARVLSLYAADEITRDDLSAMAARAYAPFDHPETAPLLPLTDDLDLLELFHGPTLAFKDVAMRMLAELYGWALHGAASGKTIIGATSGDTGGAAVAAFAGAGDVEVFMLHPKGRISDVQRRIMTTARADNICNIAVEGTFDDCQRIVKALFADERLNRVCDLGGVNSINWVRLAVQSTYFLTAAAKRPGAHFVVPTGNFGDIFAGFAAKKFGAPISVLVAATNQNDIVRRAIETGVYAPSAVSATSSPSMDIQVASNFERLLFEASGRDAGATADLMTASGSNGQFDIPERWRAAIARDFTAGRADEAKVAATMRRLHADRGLLIDPHTAVGVEVGEQLRREGRLAGRLVCLATAHPAKFPDAVESATGARPALPPRFSNLLSEQERFETAPADTAAIRMLIELKSLFARRR
ncbi:MAG: threonine synthase [Parvularculaceae bacterium]|nr:threonine synthase [Parvularculaceae bacterium]